MTVYIDNFNCKARVGGLNAKWSHMIADTKSELHAMADKLGLKREWFQEGDAKAAIGTYPAEAWHYDVTESKRKLAIKLGAVEVDWMNLPDLIHHRIETGTCR